MATKTTGKDFIRQIIRNDLELGKNEGRICTRFPPEPNGYLHIGHALSICLNFGVAKDFDGECFLRFDDTNPAKETTDFVEAIKKDVAWLGFDWGNRLTHASDYFDDIYDCAVELIEDGHAYVDSQSGDEIRQTRGTLNEPGIDSPYRNRSVAENTGLFDRMRSGEFDNGENVLRAKIDMGSSNINLRDPIIYRILHLEHQRTGNKWCIYPMYDFAHTLSDAIEGTTHSLCTLEFEDHRPLYEWFLDHLNLPNRPRQIEFSRLNLEHTITSKRKLATLVEKNIVDGWDDPRMPTLSGMRKRGYPASTVQDFCQRVGITKKDKSIEMALLENSVRERLDADSPRIMAVLNPLKVTIENYPDGVTEELDAKNHPKNPDMGNRSMIFNKEIFIEHEVNNIGEVKKETSIDVRLIGIGAVLTLVAGSTAIYIIRGKAEEELPEGPIIIPVDSTGENKAIAEEESSFSIVKGSQFSRQVMFICETGCKSEFELDGEDDEIMCPHCGTMGNSPL